MCGSYTTNNKTLGVVARTIEIEDKKEFTNDSLRNVVADFVYERCNPSDNQGIIDKGYRVGNIDLVEGYFDIYCDNEKVGFGYCEWKSWGNIGKCKNYKSKYFD